MGWTLGTTHVFVNDLGIDSKNIVTRLQPLQGGTIHQTFGYENDIYKIAGYIVGDTDLSAIQAMAKSSSIYVLSDFDGNTVMSGYVNSVSVKRIPSICQTVRLDLDSDAPIYTIEVTLYE